MVKRTRLKQRAVRGLIVLALVAVAAAAALLNLPTGDSGGSQNADLGGQPLPQLFPDARIAIVDRIVAPAQARAMRDANRWLSAHPTRDDAAFVNFALSSVGRPPSGAAQRRELAMLHRIDANRTPAGVAASVWLEAHGKKDIWKLYRHQYQDQVSPAVGDHAKAVFKATYALANQLATDGKAHFARPSPYIADPSLHALNQSRFTKKFSYPAKHSLISFALAALMTHYEPHRAAEYRWMADEISYSRMYAGGHYPSDIAAGAYLGTLLEQYELHAQSA
jgi:hypothetical protein